MKGLIITPEFDVAFARLNETQRKAVETIDGPVLVLAGPGTGKTEILAIRIGQILLKTDMKPWNILCLTFTDAGVIAMRQRLVRYLGTVGFQIPVYTFHSFCNEIIATHPDIFSQARELEQANDLETIQFATKILDELPHDSKLKSRTDPHRHAGNLVKFFSKVKQYKITPENFSSALEAYEKQLLKDEDFYYKTNSKYGKKGELKRREFDKEVSKYDRALEAVKFFPKYEELMRKSGRYDFDDMILWVLHAFEEDKDLRLRYQEQFQYFLVDEFQDTNSVQKELVDKLADYWGEKANVFVVGDDDQAIYSFQGANVKHLIDFKNQYDKTLNAFVLKENYRSNQHVLDSSRVLIENNNIRLIYELPEFTKNLVAKSDKAQKVIPKILVFDNPQHELAFVYGFLKDEYEKKKDLSHVAVMYRKHRLADDLIEVLEKSPTLTNGIKIPYTLKEEEDALKQIIVQKVLNLLRLIASEANEKKEKTDGLLFEAMHYDTFGISVESINKIFRFAYDNRISVREILRSDEKLLQADIKEIQPVKRFLSKLDEWQKTSNNETLQHTFETVLYESGILSQALASTEQEFLLNTLSAIFEELKNQTRKNPSIRLQDFLAHIDEMENFGIEIKTFRTIQQKGGVNLLTAHACKGLEFETVILFRSDKDAWERGGRSNGFNIPPAFFTQGKIHASREDEIDEESRRLFYVAMTRAKSNLTITFSKKDAKGRDRMHTQFVGELCVPSAGKNGTLQIDEAESKNENLVQVVAASLLPPPPKDSLEIDTRMVDEILENYKMAVTHLNNYLKCARYFYYENLIRVPGEKNASTAFGSAVHQALNTVFKGFKETNVLPNENEFIKEFERQMFREQDGFSDAEFEHRLNSGRDALKEFYRHYQKRWTPVMHTEYNLSSRNLVVSGVPITGKLDLVEFLKQHDVNVIDFKTGNPRNAIPKMKPLEGDYWRQLVFYKILLDADAGRGYNMVSAEILFVEKDDKDEFTSRRAVISDEEKKIVLEQIKDTYAKIKNYQFNKVDVSEKEEKCTNCRFYRICWSD